ncbi:MAG TPA: damage-inducible protein CinA, partial [Pseudomonas sp.]|nr:damage-inducible protein CinA [Pseudomonas sp.]
AGDRQAVREQTVAAALQGLLVLAVGEKQFRG